MDYTISKRTFHFFSALNEVHIMSDKNIHKGHRERVKNKFLETGFTGFADHEKLELLLFYARPQGDMNPIAHELIERFKTLGAVFDASVEQLMEVNGVKESTAILIKLIPALAKDMVNYRFEGVSLDSYRKSCDFFVSQFVGEKNEKLKIALLDDKLCLKKCVDVIEGTPSAVSLTVRKIAETAFKYNCENIIIAHNHPNGTTTPSDADINATRELYKLLGSLGISLLDHIIAAGGRAVSLKETGAFTMLI